MPDPFPAASPPIMFPFIIQPSQLPMCCSIQPTISSHHADDALAEIEARDSVFNQSRHVAPIAAAVPHIIGPVICPFRSCSFIQAAIVEQVALAELVPSLGAEFPDHCAQTCRTDASCCSAVTPEPPLVKTMTPMMTRTATARPIRISHMAWCLTDDVPSGTSFSVSVTFPWLGRLMRSR